jgi:hypothetical protein
MEKLEERSSRKVELSVRRSESQPKRAPGGLAGGIFQIGDIGQSLRQGYERCVAPLKLSFVQPSLTLCF